MQTSANTALAAPAAPAATEMLRAIWQRQQIRVSERVALIERAAGALGQGQLDASLQEQAEGAAHMLAGSLGTFGFAQASQAAHELELQLSGLDLQPGEPQPAQARAMAAQLTRMRRDLRNASEQKSPGDEQRGDEQDHNQLADEQVAFVAPVA